MNKENYDDFRKKNIAEKDAFIADFFKVVKTERKETKSLDTKYGKDNLENEPPKKRRRTVSRTSGDRAVRFNRVNRSIRKRYNTRSRTKMLNGGDTSTRKYQEEEDEDDSGKPKSNKRKLRVLFPWAKPSQRSIDLMKTECDVDEEEEDDDDDDDFRGFPARRQVYKVAKSEYDPDSIPSVDEITEDMLNNIAERSTSKQYCRVNGISCHQCRQKTLDTKTVCRSGECIGIRGQFCGPCLKGRYGESALEALKNPNWVCPPCRGLCNCSICRTRNGLPPTGILAPIAQGEGYTSVMDYLQSTETQNLSDDE